MKYQIQLYKTADLTAPRKVIAEIEGEFTQDHLNTWYSQKMTEHGESVAEGETATIVPENHQWFMVADGQPVLGPNNVVGATETKNTEKEFVPVDTVLEFAKKQNLKRREMMIKQRQEFEKMQKEFFEG